MRRSASASIVTAASAALIGSLTSTPAGAEVVVNISKSQQQLAVIVDGAERHRWPVSTGSRRYETPNGEFRPIRLERKWYSRKYNWTPMPYSIFFHRGYAVHGTTEKRNLGRAVSHGCVRLLPANASTLFSLVRAHGRPMPASSCSTGRCPVCRPARTTISPKPMVRPPRLRAPATVN